MIVHRILIATETMLLAFPMIMFSGFWVLLMIINLYKSSTLSPVRIKKLHCSDAPQGQNTDEKHR
jgi:hypothetical protein